MRKRFNIFIVLVPVTCIALINFILSVNGVDFFNNEKLLTVAAKESSSYDNGSQLEYSKRDYPYIDINSEYAILLNADTGEVLYAKNEFARCFPASTTKILTSLVALKYLNADDHIHVGDEIDMVSENSSTANLKKEQILTLEMILAGLLLPSGNDAAYSIAVNVARKVSNNKSLSDAEAVGYFCDLMNDFALEIGASSSNFTSPDGYYSENHYTTVSDMAKISACALKNDTIAKIISKKRIRHVFISKEDITWINTNQLLDEKSLYYYEKATGMKTGFNDEAGYCLVSSTNINKNNYIAIVMKTTNDMRFKDCIKLFDHVGRYILPT